MEIKIQQYIMNNLIEIISYIYEQVTFPQISISIPKSMVPIPIAEISEKKQTSIPNSQKSLESQQHPNRITKHHRIHVCYIW